MKKNRTVILTAAGLVLVGLVACVALPVQTLMLRYHIHHALGHEDQAGEIWLRVGQVKAERHVTRVFGKEAVWVELPGAYSGIAGTRYLDMISAGEAVSFVASPDNKIIICVPVNLKHLFTIESLDQYKKAQASS